MCAYVHGITKSVSPCLAPGRPVFVRLSQMYLHVTVDPLIYTHHCIVFSSVKMPIIRPSADTPLCEFEVRTATKLCYKALLLRNS